MARHGLNWPSGSPTEMNTPDSAHERWWSDRCTGILDFELKTPDHQWISPGTGRLALALLDGQEIVVQKGARRRAVAVVPGTSIKGAVRTIFELLTHSCNPLKGSRCTIDSGCPACMVFGCLGFRGRVSFDDAVPAEPGTVEFQVAMTPVPRSPDPKKTDGDFRFYDLIEMVPDDKTVPPKDFRPLAREVFRGRFVSRMRFQNLSPKVLGALIICLGCSPNPQQRFPLRLGGVKYDGKGAVSVKPLEIRLAWPHRKHLTGDDCMQTVSAWVEASSQEPWAQRSSETLAELRTVMTLGLEKGDQP